MKEVEQSGFGILFLKKNNKNKLKKKKTIIIKLHVKIYPHPESPKL